MALRRKRKGILSDSLRAAILEQALDNPYVMEKMPELKDAQKEREKKSLQKNKGHASSKKKNRLDQ